MPVPNPEKAVRNGRPETTILVVDDDAHLRLSLRDILEYDGHAVVEAGDGKTALDLVAQHAIDLILLDLQIPRVPGMDVLRQAVAEHPGIPVVIVSGKGTIRTAVEATRLGAYDFLEKPVDAQRTLLTVRHALEKASLERQRDRLLDEARARYRMVGSSPAIQRVYALIDRAAKATSKVLITGESGTGKEVVARAIHLNSRRAAGPFVPLNCAALPESLIESELFGYEKGAFTGAARQHPGTFEQARGGTLFLDEIGDMSLATQAKVLRVLEGGTVQRLGGTSPIRVDARIIAATNKDLPAEVETGRFREDLFYRLNIVHIHVPPLHARRTDIPDLVRHFLALHGSENGADAWTLHQIALQLLIEHDWPGNVRQLRNVVERLVVFSDGDVITPADVQHALRPRSAPPEPLEATTDLRTAREAFERTFIRNALIAHDGQIQQTADALGIDRSHLWKKMRRYGIDTGT